MKNLLNIISFSLFLCFNSFGQVPKLTGTIQVSVLNGTIDADIELSNLPSLQNYYIYLNTGFNVEFFRDVQDQFNYGFEKGYNANDFEEAFQYFFPANDNVSKFLPKGFKIKYTGKFPVIADKLRADNWGDWKGNIAFNGQTLRASEQCAWYPVLYDITNDVLIDKYTFNVRVECVDCKSIYLNGDLPKTTQASNFTSLEPVPLLLFMGHYDFIKKDQTYLLNTTINEAEQSTLSARSNEIKSFYEKHLNIPYGKPVVYISTTPISKKNEWAFVTYPTIVVVGIDQYKLDNYFDKKNATFKDKSQITFIAHELGHYYVGTVFVPNSTLFWFFLEGLTDYLSVKATQEIIGETQYQQIINRYMESIKSVSNFNPIPLNKIKNASEINERYRYHYVPLMLLAIESELGADQMWKWVQVVLRSEVIKTDYVFFVNSFLDAGVPQAKVDEIVEKYILSESATENIFKALK